MVIQARKAPKNEQFVRFWNSFYNSLSAKCSRMTIVIYSTTTCPYCKMLKDYLKEKNLTYTEKLVDTDETAKNEMVASSGGFLGVPFVVITKDDGNKETVIGFDKGKLNTLLGIQ